MHIGFTKRFSCKTFTVAALVGLVVVASYSDKLSRESLCDPTAIDYMWRLLIGLGCVPGALGLYFRLTIPETPRFTMDIERNVQQAAADIDRLLETGDFQIDRDEVVQRVDAPKATKEDFITYFSRWENLKILIGTAYSWFALDVRIL